jgi:Ca-activated chloride channel family protein
MLFSGSSQLMAEKSVDATTENIAKAISVIDSQQGGGGTELLPAMQKALSLQKLDGYSRTIVVVTDGYVTVEKEAFDLIRNNLGAANLFAFGIGSSVNRFIIEGMAHVGMGEPFIITKQEEAPGKAEKFRKLIQSPALTNIKIDYSGFSVKEVEPPAIPDVLAERPVIVFGKWSGKPDGTIRLTGVTGKETYTQEIKVADVSPHTSNEALRYLWARHRIALLSDYNKVGNNTQLVNEITNLGLKYNLLTDYTSFVAIDTEVRLKDGKATTVKQPLPMPEGVSDYSVGRSRQLAVSPMAAPPMVAHDQAATSMPKKEAVKGDYNEAKSLEKDEKRLEEETAGVKKNKAQSSIELLNVTSTEGLTVNVVETAIKKNLAPLTLCYQNALSQQPQALGNGVFKLVVNPAGVVTKVELVSITVTNKGFEQCMLNALKALLFPVPTNGKSVTLVVTFLLK